MLVCFFILHARLRARWAPGIPCALCLQRAECEKQNSRESRGEITKMCLNVIASAAKQSTLTSLLRDGLLAEPVIGRAFALPVGSQ
jgi:hypothetical protein